MSNTTEDQYLQQFDGDDDDIEILEVVGLDEDSPAALPVDAAEPRPEEIVLSLDDGPAEPGTVATDTPHDERLTRLQADFENLTKRAERERLEYGGKAVSYLVSRLLPVLDNFERAIEAAEGGANADPLQQGVVLIFRQLLDELRKEGLRAIEPVGQPFDPTVHEAVETLAPTGHARYRVIEEVQRGYFFNGRLLRPAQVKVGIDDSETDG